MARLPSYIRRVETPAGPRYEVRVNPRVGGDSRRQLKRRFPTVAEASEWYTRTIAEFGDGTYIADVDLTVKQACEAWLKAKALRIKPTTLDAYIAALAPVIERYGDRCPGLEAVVEAVRRHPAARPEDLPPPRPANV